MKISETYKDKKIHCIGIGGSGLSGLAKLLHAKGAILSGSTNRDSDICQDLMQNYGIEVTLGHSAELISNDTDIVIYTRAINESHPELQEAQLRSIPSYSYPEFLGKISQSLSTIAVAGTNGKTTTTTMLAEIMSYENLDPNVIVGGILQKFNTNYLSGNSNYFLSEACEYKRSFLNISHSILLITNISEDHLDYYKDIGDIQDAFCELLEKNVTEKKVLICNPKGENMPKVINRAKELLYEIIDYTQDKYSKLDLLIPGEHNRQNAAAALAVLSFLKKDGLAPAKKYLENEFVGSKRRMDKIGVTKSGSIVYDDYAHNPEGIRLLIEGIRSSYPDKNICLIFEPHLYSRTEDFKEGFVESLSLADKLYLLPVYRAREEYDKSREFLLDPLLRQNTTNTYRSFSDYQEATKQLLDEHGDQDILVFAGAGTITELAHSILKK